MRGITLRECGALVLEVVDLQLGTRFIGFCSSLGSAMSPILVCTNMYF